MAGVASSVAFACTQQIAMAPAGGVLRLEAPAGATVVVESKGFIDPALDTEGFGAPTFSWNSINGIVLGTAGAPVQTPGTSESKGQVWTTALKIPAIATPSPDPYRIFGWQTKANGQIHNSGAVQVFVTAPTGTTRAAPRPPGSAPSAGTSTQTAAPASVSNGQPTTAPGAPQTAAGAAATVMAGQTAAAPSAAAPATASQAAAAQAAATTASASTASGRTTAADPTKPIPVPAPNEMWSGLSQSRSALSLLDAPAPATNTGGGFPAGAALLGMGVLALGGAAAMAGQQRLVRVTRR